MFTYSSIFLCILFFISVNIFLHCLITLCSQPFAQHLGIILFLEEDASLRNKAKHVTGASREYGQHEKKKACETNQGASNGHSFQRVEPQVSLVADACSVGALIGCDWLACALLPCWPD